MLGTPHLGAVFHAIRALTLTVLHGSGAVWFNRFVVNKVLAPMESTDPFAEDFYFLQVSSDAVDLTSTPGRSLDGVLVIRQQLWLSSLPAGSLLLLSSLMLALCLLSFQMSIKKNAAAREEALKEQRELPKPIYVPLPVWKETKERIRMQMDVTRKGFHERSREWEQKEQVRRLI